MWSVSCVLWSFHGITPRQHSVLNKCEPGLTKNINKSLEFWSMVPFLQVEGEPSILLIMSCCSFREHCGQETSVTPCPQPETIKNELPEFEDLGISHKWTPFIEVDKACHAYPGTQRDLSPWVHVMCDILDMSKALKLSVLPSEFYSSRHFLFPPLFHQCAGPLASFGKS